MKHTTSCIADNQLPTNPDQLLDLAEVAGLLHISERSVWRLVASDELPPPVKIGRCVRWFAGDIQAYLDRLRERRDGSTRFVANRRGAI